MIPFNVQSVNIKWRFWNSFTITSLFPWKIYTKGQWQSIFAAPVVIPLDLFPCLIHTGTIKKTGGFSMDSKFTEELRQKYIKNPPEGMTAKLVKNMTDSDLLDMHYFLTEDDDLEDDEFEEGFYVDLF